jgi:ketosteroid isomerase-like protein
MFPRFVPAPLIPRSSMRVRLSLLPFLLLSFGCASASSGASASGDAERSLHARSDGLQAAESALDGARATAFWATDAVIQPAGSPAVVGRDAIGALYRSFFSSGAIKELRGTPTKVTMAKSGDLAYETGVNRIVLKTPNGDMLDMGKYLLVWKRIDGEWYASALAFTSDAAAPVPMK